MVAGCGTMTSAPPPAIGGNESCSGIGASTSNLSGTTNVPATPQGTNESGPTRSRANENRRSNKPIMEKRRRARINNCLNELKTLILDAMKKDPARHSKLEKADILEMTVKHLEALQRQQVAMAAASDSNVANKFRAGFTECAGEVGRFPGLEGPVKRRLLQHLANCLNAAIPATNMPPSEPVATNPPLQVHILRTAVQNETPAVQQTNSSNIIVTNTNGQGLQLVPTRLPNGDIALILPSSNSIATTRTTLPTSPSSSPSSSVSSNSSGSSPLPLLIPIPSRSNTNPSSPVALDRLSMNSSTPRQITILTTQNPQRIIIPHNKEKSVSLLTSVPCQYECSEKLEKVIQQRVLIPEIYHKSEKLIKGFNEIPVMHNVEPSNLKTRKDDCIENLNNYTGNSNRLFNDDSLYKPNQVIMAQDGQINENEYSTKYITDKIYNSDGETLLHIPEKDYYERGLHSVSPRSPVGYIENIDNTKYSGYYSDHLDRPYSPEMQKPLALVTKKKNDEFDNDDRPWRPW